MGNNSHRCFSCRSGPVLCWHQISVIWSPSMLISHHSHLELIYECWALKHFHNIVNERNDYNQNWQSGIVSEQTQGHSLKVPGEINIIALELASYMTDSKKKKKKGGDSNTYLYKLSLSEVWGIFEVLGSEVTIIKIEDSLTLLEKGHRLLLPPSKHCPPTIQHICWKLYLSAYLLFLVAEIKTKHQKNPRETFNSWTDRNISTVFKPGKRDQKWRLAMGLSCRQTCSMWNNYFLIKHSVSHKLSNLSKHWRQGRCIQSRRDVFVATVWWHTLSPS